MNKFLRNHIVDMLHDPLYDGDKGCYLKDEIVQTQIKFLRSKLNEIQTMQDFNDFIAYINIIAINYNLALGVSEKNFIKQFIALVIFIDSLSDKKQRPTVLKDMKFELIVNKFKNALVKTYHSAVYIEKITASSQDILNFVNFIYRYNTDNASIKCLSKKDKEICLDTLSVEVLIRLNQYAYMANNIKRSADFLQEIVTLMKLIVWQDEKIMTYNDNPHWKEFQLLLKRLAKYLIKTNKININVYNNFIMIKDNVVRSSEIRLLLNDVCKKIDNYLKKQEREKKKREKEQANFKLHNTSGLVWANNTASLISDSISKTETEELVKTVDDKVEELKSTANRKKKIRIHGGY